MCRVHSIERIADRALAEFNRVIFGDAPNCETDASGIHKSLKILCFNLRKLSENFNFWNKTSDITFSWPKDYVPIDFSDYVFLTDLQKLFGKLVSNKDLKMSDINQKFVPVGVRWLGFFCSLLHAILTMDYVISFLEKIETTSISSKTQKSIIDNTLHMMRMMKQHQDCRAKIFRFACVYFESWRETIVSDGSTIFTSCMTTSRNLARIGMELQLPEIYFDTICKHLYDIDGVFLPLSSNQQHTDLVIEYLKQAVARGYVYKPALFKDRPILHLDSHDLCNLNLDLISEVPSFQERVISSPLFKHLGCNLNSILEIYQHESEKPWLSYAKLIPAHNQSCERLIGDLKLSADIDTLIAVDENRKKRERSKGHVNKQQN